MDSEHHQAFVRLKSKTTGDWFVAPELRARLVADAQEQGTNLTEVAVGILCRRYSVAYEPNGRRANPKADDGVLNLRLPVRLYRAIKASTDGPYQDAIRAALCEHYGLSVPARARAAA